jgi:hypothetical protein
MPKETLGGISARICGLGSKAADLWRGCDCCSLLKVANRAVRDCAKAAYDYPKLVSTRTVMKLRITGAFAV